MRRALMILCLLSALGAVAPRGAGALTRPDLAFTAGSTFGITGDPNGGGLSLSASPLWRLNKQVSFGFSLFADDMGTRVGDLRDPNNGVHLGTVPLSHRWTYGGAWRADATVLTRKRWDADLVGQWGYWRLEDDLRGDVTGAASAVGFTVGANIRHPLTGPQGLGLAVRYHRLFTDRNAAYGRVDQYATLALEWRWAGPVEP